MNDSIKGFSLDEITVSDDFEQKVSQVIETIKTKLAGKTIRFAPVPVHIPDVEEAVAAAVETRMRDAQNGKYTVSRSSYGVNCWTFNFSLSTVAFSTLPGDK